MRLGPETSTRRGRRPADTKMDERRETKTFAQLSAVGTAAVLLLKLLGMIVVPRLGLLAAPLRQARPLRRSAAA